MRRHADTARQQSPGWHRLRHPRLRSDRGAIADLDMIDHAHLSSQRDILAEFGTSGDAGLSGDYRVFSDDNVMRNLHEVIDLCPSTDQGAAECSPVDRAIGADLDIVFDFDNTHLRDFDPLIADSGVAKAVAADHNTGV
jgi:hypothetical protein